MIKKIIILLSLFIFLAVAYSAYLFLRRDPFEGRFPIVFNAAQVPTTEVKIEGQSYFLKIDLGASAPITLTSHVLEKIQKEYCGQIHSFDLKGNDYCSKLYRVPEIRVRNMKLSDFKVREESDHFLNEGSVIYQKKGVEPTLKDDGSLGLPVFRDVNLFLDFHRSMVFACRHLRDRKREGYDVDSFVRLPMEPNPLDEIVVTIRTDVGAQRFMIDTGCSRSLIKPSAIEGAPRRKWRDDLEMWSSSQFILGEKDFGGLNFLIVPIDSRFGDFDGIIGMDFLKNHIVYLDFKQKTASIAKAQF